jgi:hypothetical protein
MYDYLLEVGYTGNLEIINARPGWDLLDKLKIEHRRSEMHAAASMAVPK